MKKIDLHIHTEPTITDSHFDFSLEKLKEYVHKLDVDCIAITNHNQFNLEQFKVITEALPNTVVLPGIEIDLEGCHLLLISEPVELVDFFTKCNQVRQLIQTKSDSINVDTLKKIYINLGKYLLIPHYDKRPYIKEETYKKLSEHIYAGEVTSIKKFKTCIREEGRLTPVIFSDFRFSDSMGPFSTGQTFIDLDEITLSGIKACLFDKNKVALSKDDGNEFFQATEDGLMLSTGLNVILGERSSGKTHTLNKVCRSFSNVKYIEQFSLLQNNEEKFEELLSVRHSTASENFLREFKSILPDIVPIDLRQNEIEVEKYLTSLLKYASENERSDTFSKAVFFSETLFPESDTANLKTLIDATLLLIENNQYQHIINKYLNLNALKSLLFDLINTHTHIEEVNLKQRWLNDVMTNMKDGLKFHTSTTTPEDMDFYKFLMDKEKINKFTAIVNNLKMERDIESKEIQGFKVVASTKRFNGAGELKRKSGKQKTFSEAFQFYNKPYDYLCALKKVDIPETEYYKYFVDIDYKTLNKHGVKVSGGERSEFNLLHEIQDALKYQLLLIDEPESSFDNIFLKNEVNELLKMISKEIPVIIVTHNNTVGASIIPDYIAYTQKEVVEGDLVYKVFTGYPSSKILKSTDGTSVDNYNIMLKCLEAGKDAYIERRKKSYEILENQG